MATFSAAAPRDDDDEFNYEAESSSRKGKKSSRAKASIKTIQSARQAAAEQLKSAVEQDTQQVLNEMRTETSQLHDQLEMIDDPAAHRLKRKAQPEAHLEDEAPPSSIKGLAAATIPVHPQGDGDHDMVGEDTGKFDVRSGAAAALGRVRTGRDGGGSRGSGVLLQTCA